MTVVRPEFGPTLPELLGPRVRLLPRPVRLVLAAVAAAAVIAVLALALGGGEATRAAVVRGPVTFNLIYGGGLARVQPHRGELLRLEGAGSAAHPLSYRVRAISLPHYDGDINGFLPYYATRIIDAMKRADPAFRLRGEGRVRINDVPGYALQYQTRAGGHLTFGRRLLLFPDEPGVRLGADVLLLAAFSPQVPNVESIGGAGALKVPLRSFRFGTQRP